MKKPVDSASFSEAETAILTAALQNPDATNAEIAEETGARVALVRDVRAEYEDEVELPDDVADADTGSVDAGGDFSPAQQAILDAAAADPEATNADIAEETGARITLVRDTLAAHGDEIEATGGDGGSDESTAAASKESSDTQQAILDAAAENPDASNAEIADQVGARITLVRDTLAEHGDEASASSGSSGGSGGSDTSGGSDDLHSEIIALADENPDLTNREIAEEVGARLTLVRDTLADNDYSGEIETASGGELPAGVSASMLNETEQAILELAQEDETLTNADIAAKTGTTVAVVRDTRVTHEPGKSADYGGQGTIEEDDDDDEDETADTDESREWEPGEPSDLQEEILELALENEELTNSEIAAETGARLTLVRDTLADYDDLTLADLEGGVASSYEPEEPSSWSDLSDTEQAILNAAADDSEATNAEIAEETGARVTLVRDTRENYGDLGPGDAGGAADSSEAAAADDDGVPTGRLIALAVILLIVLLVVLSL